MTNNFELKVLGSLSPYQKGNKNCVGYLISCNDEKIMLDCGNGITRLLKFPDDLNNLSIFISHLHKDHYGDLLSLGYASYVYNKLGLLKDKIKLYIPITNSDEEEYYDYLLITNMKEQYFDIHFYNQNSLFNINDINISFIENIHSIKCFSTKIEANNRKIVYTGDTGYKVIDRLIPFSKDADLLVCESTFLLSDNQHSNVHLHAFESAEIAKLANVKKLLLTHFWPEHNPLEYLEEASEIFKNTDIAQEGKTLILKEKNH